MPARIDRVREDIERAFVDVPYPGDDQLVRGRDDESQDVREAFKGKHWNNIPRDILRYHHDSLPFFSPAALRYYLPAYLLAALDEFWDILHFVVCKLCPGSEMPGYNGPQDYFSTWFSGFTPEQKSAVKMFLEYIRDERADHYMMRDDVELALEQYWGK